MIWIPWLRSLMRQAILMLRRFPSTESLQCPLRDTESTYEMDSWMTQESCTTFRSDEKSEELQPTAETLFISLIKSEENTYKDDAQAADETADEAADEKLQTKKKEEQDQSKLKCNAAALS